MAFVQVTLDQYLCNGTYLFQVLSLAEQFRSVALLNANNSGSSGPSGVRSREKEVSEGGEAK